MTTTKVVFWLNVGFAILIFILAGILFYSYLTPDPRDSHGGMYGYFGAVFLTPVSVLFSLIAFAIRKNWKYKWLLQASPLLIVAVVILLDAR
jgi:hypothetical protein